VLLTVPPFLPLVLEIHAV